MDFFCEILLVGKNVVKMLIPDAYKYLRDFGGIDFLFRHWEVEHTQHEMYTHMTLLKICRRNGGWL